MEFRIISLVMIFTTLSLSAGFSEDGSELSTKIGCELVGGFNNTGIPVVCQKVLGKVGTGDCCKWDDGYLKLACCSLNTLDLGLTCDGGYTAEACKTCKPIQDKNAPCDDSTFGERPTGTNGVARCCRSSDDSAKCCVTSGPDNYVGCEYFTGYKPCS